MINIVIIQNSPSELASLEEALVGASDDLKIDAKLSSVMDSIKYILTHDYPDIIFTDIVLSDGLSSDIFHYTRLAIPTVFISDFENFKMIQNENTGIDFIAKPIKSADLAKSLNKFKNLKTYFSTHKNRNLTETGFSIPNSKRRLLLRRGQENVVLRLEEIAYIFTYRRVVFIIDRALQKYSSEKTLNELEQLLPDAMFFRANRQYIINIDFIKSFKTSKNLKLQVNLDLHKSTHSIMISQKNARYFKRWMQEA